MDRDPLGKQIHPSFARNMSASKLAFYLPYISTPKVPNVLTVRKGLAAQNHVDGYFLWSPRALVGQEDPNPPHEPGRAFTALRPWHSERLPSSVPNPAMTGAFWVFSADDHFCLEMAGRRRTSSRIEVGLVASSGVKHRLSY
jgi:hypothetical protein